MTALLLSLFGGFQLAWYGQPLNTFESNKVRALLAYLAVEANRPHERTKLGGLLWPDHPEEAARTNLRHVLRQLRLALPDAADAAPFLLTDFQRIQFNPVYTVAVDVNQFVNRVVQSERCRHRQVETCPACLERYRQAADLYTGEFLAGLSFSGSDLFEEWAVMQREQLHRQALDLFFTLATHHEAQGEFVSAEHYTRRQLALEPWREEGHRQLMRLLARSGQRSAALAQFALCRKLLADELSVEPDAETVTLYEQIRSGKLDRERGKQENRETKRAQEEGADHSIQTLQDWGEAPATPYLYGRQAESDQIKRWLLDERCRVVVVLGMGGMGKTTIVTSVARALAGDFAFIFWRSLLNAPPLAEFLRGALQFLSRQQLTTLPDSLNEQLALLVAYLGQQRCLIVLDNAESILAPDQPGQYRPGYEAYGQLIERVAQGTHQSALLLTSRERPRGVDRLEEDLPVVRTLQLAGLSEEAGQAILRLRGVRGDEAAAASLVQRYSGNPLALRLVSRTIQDLFDGDLTAFLGEDAPVFDDIRTVLHQQFHRLTALEREILIWLAVEREGTPVASLRQQVLSAPTQRELLEALKGLQRRSLLEKTEAGFTLQNVVAEYVTDSLVEQACREVTGGALHLLRQHSLLKAQAQDTIRQSQERLILAPVARHLLKQIGPERLSDHLRALLDRLRATEAGMPSYAAGNLLNLLLHLQVDVTGYDFSGLSVWQAYLCDAVLPAVNFTGANLAQTVFYENFGQVEAVAFSPNGQYLAATPGDGGIHLWRIADRVRLGVLYGHSGLIWSLAFSPDGQWLVSAGVDREVCLWDVRDLAQGGHLVRKLSGHEDIVRAVAFAPDGQTIASVSDCTIRLWDRQSGQLRHTLRGSEQQQWGCVTFSPDGTLLATGSMEHHLWLWDVQTGAPLHALHGHTNWVRSLAFHPNGRVLASTSNDSTVRLWQLAAIRNTSTFDVAGDVDVCQALPGDQHRAYRVLYSPDGTLLAIAGHRSDIRLWAPDAANGPTLQGALVGHSDPILGLAFHPSGKMLASSSMDQTVRLWDVASGQSYATLQGYSNWLVEVAFSPDGRTLASSGSNGTVQLWTVSNHTSPHNRAKQTPQSPSFPGEPKPGMKLQLGHTLRAPKQTIHSVDFSPDGTLLASGSNTGAVQIWNPSTGQRLKGLEDHTDFVRAVQFSPDGQQLLSGGSDTVVRLWDVQYGTVVQRFPRTTWTRAIAVHPNGNLLATGGDDRLIYLWVRTGDGTFAPREPVTGHAGAIFGIAFNPDGTCLATASGDRTIRLWQLLSPHTAGEPMIPDLECVTVLHGHTSWVRTLCFTPDGRQLVSGGDDRAVRVWDVASGQCRYTLTRHTNSVQGVAIHPEGQWLVTCALDATINVWQLADGAHLQSYRHPGPYPGMKITRVSGINPTQKAALKALGAVEE
jgi:WD40 repeat protein/DNA-binding SARP family transcriptional activator